jgi:hypothetical protein
MIPGHVAALALADSVGALDPDEQAELEAYRAELLPEEQAQLGRLYETATAVATAVDLLEPPAHVRERVLGAAGMPGRAVNGKSRPLSRSAAPETRDRDYWLPTFSPRHRESCGRPVFARSGPVT